MKLHYLQHVPFENLANIAGWAQEKGATISKTLTKDAQKSPIFNNLPDHFVGFHWHGDTFDLPAECIRIAASEGCSNQAFEYQGRVIGLQFHLESSTESIKQLVQNCGHEITGGKYVQSAKAILAQDSYLPELNKTMNLLLDSIYSKT